VSLSFASVVSIALLALFADNGAAQTKADKIRIGYAARAVAHSVPYVTKEAGFFTEERIEAEIVRTAGSIAPMALVANEVDIAIMSAYLMIPVSVQNRDVVMLGGFSRFASMVFVARPDIKRRAGSQKEKLLAFNVPVMRMRRSRGLLCGIWAWTRTET
jgi:ABC-type nitrate/sulfonate/bicarbonate transport system substrate-binding protein